MLEAALADAFGTGESPRFVPEEFIVEEIFVKSGAVEGDEGFIFSWAVVVDGLCRQFFAGACFTLNEHGRTCWGNALEAGDDIVHFLAIANHPFEAEFFIYLALEVTVGTE